MFSFVAQIQSERKREDATSIGHRSIKVNLASFAYDISIQTVNLLAEWQHK